jgi:hypothetical protein
MSCRSDVDGDEIILTLLQTTVIRVAAPSVNCLILKPRSYRAVNTFPLGY